MHVARFLGNCNLLVCWVSAGVLPAGCFAGASWKSDGITHARRHFQLHTLQHTHHKCRTLCKGEGGDECDGDWVVAVRCVLVALVVLCVPMVVTTVGCAAAMVAVGGGACGSGGSCCGRGAAM